MLTIVDAKPADAAAIADLFIEMDNFYGESIMESSAEKLPQINSVLFGNPPLAYAVLAWDDTRLVGIAAYSYLWPAARATKSLYLKELYVSQDCRRSGVGRQLMEHLIQIANNNDCTRVEWTTDNDNVEAQKFYEKLGFFINPGKRFYRIAV